MHRCEQMTGSSLLLKLRWALVGGVFSLCSIALTCLMCATLLWSKDIMPSFAYMNTAMAVADAAGLVFWLCWLTPWVLRFGVVRDLRILAAPIIVDFSAQRRRRVQCYCRNSVHIRAQLGLGAQQLPVGAETRLSRCSAGVRERHAHALVFQLAIAVNRFIAVSRPFDYATLFTNGRTFTTIGVCVAATTAYFLVEHFGFGASVAGGQGSATTAGDRPAQAVSVTTRMIRST